MAITNNFGSLLVSPYSASPQANQTGVDIGSPDYKISTAAILTTDSIGSTYRMCQVSSGDICTALKYSCTALTAGALSIGLYLPNTGAVVSVALFATSIASGSAVTQADERYATKTIATMGQRIWQLLGLASDPVLTYDLVLTSTTAATANGTLATQYEYVK